MTLGLQKKITLLSVLSVTLISMITFLTILYFYYDQSLKNVDKLLESDSKAVKQSLNFDKDGRLDLSQRRSNSVASYSERSKIYYMVFDAKHQPLLRSDPMIIIEIPRSITLEGFSYTTFFENEYRLLSQSYLQSEHNGSVDLHVHVLRPMRALYKDVTELFYILLLMLPLPILLAGVGSWWIARHTIQPIQTLIKTVETIDLESLDTTLPVIRNDEVGKLTESFNTLLSRLNNAFKSLQRFTADASHELRTPLTVIRTQAEVALQKPRDKDEYQQTIISTLEEISRLENLTDTLLQLTRADAGITKLSASPVNISRQVLKWLENLTPLADEKNIDVESDIADDVTIAADRTVFECVVINLLNNAIQYTPSAGKIGIQLVEEKNAIRFVIEDSGPGIPESEKLTVFDRFKRLQQTRHTSTGAGLGLSLVQWAVTSHGGKVWVEDSSLGGCTFIVTLPSVQT